MPSQRWPGVEVGDPHQVSTELQNHRRGWGAGLEASEKTCLIKSSGKGSRGGRARRVDPVAWLTTTPGQPHQAKAWGRGSRDPKHRYSISS